MPEATPVMSEPMTMPATASATDAEVDIEVMKSTPTKFAVEDEKSANWLVRRIIAARQYALNVKTWSQIEQRRAEREEATLLFLYGRQIEMWAREEIEKLGGRRKSINLPGGTVSFRKENAKLVVNNETVLLEWARRNLPNAIQKIEKLLKTPVNEHFEATGELPDGTHLEPEREKFRIS